MGHPRGRDRAVPRRGAAPARRPDHVPRRARSTRADRRRARPVGGAQRGRVGRARAAHQPERAGRLPGYQMLYRFADAATEADLTRHQAAIAAAAPRGSLTGTQSYLNVKHAAERAMAVYVPFVVAFGVLGLCMSVLTIGVVVNGAVGAATRRIGVLKSLGFTPAQVVRAYVGQALIPAAVGTVLGLGLGNLLAVPAMRQEGTPSGPAPGRSRCGSTPPWRRWRWPPSRSRRWCGVPRRAAAGGRGDRRRPGAAARPGPRDPAAARAAAAAAPGEHRAGRPVRPSRPVGGHGRRRGARRGRGHVVHRPLPVARRRAERAGPPVAGRRGGADVHPAAARVGGAAEDRRQRRGRPGHRRPARQPKGTSGRSRARSGSPGWPVPPP